MYAPTLSGAEDLLLPIDPIRRGDVLYSNTSIWSEIFIKRVIGLQGKPRVEGEEGLRQRDSLDEPYVYLCFQLMPPAATLVKERSTSGALRPGDGARRALLHDGRQSRQLAGQPLLGLHAAEHVKGKALFVHSRW